MSMVQLETSSLSKVYFVSLGCPKNLVDSQVMLGLLEKDQYQITSQPQDAQVIIVNTCSFIQAAKEESIETVLEMADYKNTGACKVLVMSGCLAQRYAQDLEQKMPEVDLFLGTGEYHRITDVLREHGKALELGGTLPRRSYVNQPAFIHTEKDIRVQTGASYSAYLKISEGCNRRCAFCIIPKLRGNVRSRKVESLVTEARAMVQNGVREINLVAQDLTEYGMEWKYKERLETLLPELCKIEGLYWIRLHYVYPDQFSDELIDIIAREPKIVKYLDMPIQHTNDRVLKLMNRRLTKEKLYHVISRLRERIPGLVIRTSIIVGFPTETQEEFEELCEDLLQLNLQHVGVFRYSREEGTPAAQMDGQVHPSTKRNRERRLIELLQKQRWQALESSVGKKVDVLVEGISDQTDLLLKGRMSTQAHEIDGSILINEVALASEETNLVPGDLVEVELVQAHTEGLVGKVLRRLVPPPQVTFNSRSFSVSASH